MHGREVPADEIGATRIAARLARRRDARAAVGDPRAARDVADQHGVERRGGLAGGREVRGDGAQVRADPRDRDTQVRLRAEDGRAVDGRVGGPRAPARRYPRRLREPVEPGRPTRLVGVRAGIPPRLGLHLRDDPQRRQLGALGCREVADQGKGLPRQRGQCGRGDPGHDVGRHGRRRGRRFHDDEARNHRSQRCDESTQDPHRRHPACAVTSRPRSASPAPGLRCGSRPTIRIARTRPARWDTDIDRNPGHGVPPVAGSCSGSSSASVCSSVLRGRAGGRWRLLAEGLVPSVDHHPAAVEGDRH